MPFKSKKEQQKWSKKYYIKHRTEILKRVKKYRNSAKGKAVIKEHRQSVEYKMHVNNLRKTPKHRARANKLRRTPKHRAQQNSYRATSAAYAVYIKNYMTPTRISWQAMIARCTNTKLAKYKIYGALGVTVCKRWLKFENFLEDMGPRIEGTTLSRFGDIGNYKPSNCAWHTRAQQEKQKKLKRQNKAA